MVTLEQHIRSSRAPIYHAKPFARPIQNGKFAASVVCNWTYRINRTEYATKEDATAAANSEILEMRQLCANDLRLAAAGIKTRPDGSKAMSYTGAGWLLKMYGGDPAAILSDFLNL